MALRLLEEAPIQLLDRLTNLDPSGFGPVIEAADRARYILFERLAHVRSLARAEHRARALLSWLREGEADWNEVLEAAESLVPGFAPGKRQPVVSSRLKPSRDGLNGKDLRRRSPPSSWRAVQHSGCCSRESRRLRDGSAARDTCPSASRSRSICDGPTRCGPHT